MGITTTNQARADPDKVTAGNKRRKPGEIFFSLGE
jgi:hypothetical protein